MGLAQGKVTFNHFFDALVAFVLLMLMSFESRMLFRWKLIFVSAASQEDLFLSFTSNRELDRQQEWRIQGIWVTKQTGMDMVFKERSLLRLNFCLRNKYYRRGCLSSKRILRILYFAYIFVGLSIGKVYLC